MAINKIKINDTAHDINDSRIGTYRVTLSYHNNTTLKGSYSLEKAPEAVFAQVRYQAGTPYGQITELVTQVTGNTVTIYAYGSGFVSGHVLSVDTLYIM